MRPTDGVCSDTEGHSPSILRHMKNNKNKDGCKSKGSDGSKCDAENQGSTLKTEKSKSLLSQFMDNKDRTPKAPNEKISETPESRNLMTLKLSPDKKLGVKLQNRVKSPNPTEAKAKGVCIEYIYSFLSATKCRYTITPSSSPRPSGCHQLLTNFLKSDLQEIAHIYASLKN